MIQGKTVDFGNWLKVDDKELERGQDLGKVREKILKHDEMLSFV